MPIVLALGCALVYGVADYCGGRASRVMPSAVVTVSGQMVSLVLVIAAVIVLGTPLPGAGTWWWGGAGGLAGAIGLTAFYFALGNGAMSTVAPVTAVVSVLPPIIVGLLDGDRPAPIGYVGMALAVVAVALVSGVVASRHQRTPRPVMTAAVLAGVGFGLLFVCLDRAGDDSGLWPLAAVRIVSVSATLTYVISRGMRPARGTPEFRLALMAGVLDMTANVLYLEAVRTGLLSIVGVVSALYPVSTVALAFVIDRERVTRWQGIGMCLAAVAVTFTVLA